jgi:RecA-family ATPase
MDSGFTGLTPDELESWTPPKIKNIIDKNILPKQGILVIYGSEGTFKSMIAMDLMYRIATGQPWFGFNTVSSPIYYFQSEISQNLLQERSRKYRIGNGINTSKCWLATDLYTKVDKSWGTTRIEQELSRTRPDVLIIDPLNNSTSANLVNDYETGQMLDVFNRWRQAFNCAIILIHHNRQAEHKEGQAFHYGTDEMFGTRIKKWADTIVYVEQVADNDPIVDLKLSFEKTRHAESKINPIDVQVSRDNLVFTRKYGKEVLQTARYS